MIQTSAMREAFFKMQVPANAESGPVVKAAIHAVARGAGQREVRPWNAHLKLRTYNVLVKQEVM